MEGPEIRRMISMAIVIACLVLSASFAGFLLSPVPHAQKPIVFKQFIESQYTQHGRIYVTNDSEFIGAGFAGSGTEADPYVISDVIIESQSDAVMIQHTTSHFIIQDSWLSSSAQGVLLSQVRFGHILHFAWQGSRKGFDFRTSAPCSPP